MGSFRAELLLLRKARTSWVLVALTVGLTVLLGYVLPYVAYRGEGEAQRNAKDLADLLPGSLVATVLSGFPFWFGVLALILGVLVFGSEYGWGTLKTTLLQQPGRQRHHQ